MSSVNSVSGAVINIFKGSSRGDLRQSLWRKYENLFGSKASSTVVSWNEDVLERPRMYQHPLSETAPIPASERVEEVTEAPWWRKQELLPPVNKFVAGWYDLKDMDEKEEKWRQLLGEHYDHRGARKKKQMHEPIDWRHGQRSLVEKKFLTHRTYQVLDAVFQSKDSIERSARMQLLVQHLWDFPLSRPIAIRADAIKRLLQLRDSDEAKGIEGEIRQGLTLLGYVFSPIGNGIRLLSLDGGGTRGVVSLEVLRRLESLTGKRIHQLFDMIVGVSTGALIGFLLGPMKKSVTECEVMYRDMAQRIFAPSSFLKHQMNLITTHGYYSAQGLTDVMKEILGETQLVDTMRDPECPKIAIISALVNVGPLQPFVFRNYTIPPFTSASCPGTTDFLMWEGGRATTSAPGYFQEFTKKQFIHQDGGIVANNPTGIGIEEANLLWPNYGFECVISLGTGKFEHDVVPEGKPTTIKAKLEQFINSATDTERVHFILQELLQPECYFRFNPPMTEMIMLDEIRTHKLVQMQREAASYVRRNRWKVEEAVRIITREKSVKRKTWETINDVVQKFGLRAINLHSYLGIINMIRSPKIQGPTYKPTT